MADSVRSVVGYRIRKENTFIFVGKLRACFVCLVSFLHLFYFPPLSYFLPGNAVPPSRFSFESVERSEWGGIFHFLAFLTFFFFFAFSRVFFLFFNTG